MRANPRKKRPTLAVLALTTIAVVLAWPSHPAFGLDPDDVNRANEAKDARRKARLEAGWQPKSPTEQLLTRIRATGRAIERKKDRETQRAIFEAARAEVYLQMARCYASIGYTYRVYSPSLIVDRNTGVITPFYRPVLVVDPLAARLSVYFAEKAALGKAMAAAREYRANTFYRKRVENAEFRIAALQNQAKLERQLAGKLQP